MKLYLRGHGELYAVEQLQMQLFPAEPSELVEAPFGDEDGTVSTLHRTERNLIAATKITYKGKTAAATRRIPLAQEDIKSRRRILQQSYYRAAVQLLEQVPPWGALAGVRPTKISTAFLLEGGSLRDCDRMLEKTYFVTPERRRLCLDASEHTLAAVDKLRERDLSLYIGVPFCPTRCVYCSFVSESVEKLGNLVEPYLQALLREVRATGPMLKRSGYHIRTLYVGGGTPTTFSAEQLTRLLTAVRESFDLSRCLELTVEGGRPDTLDEEKLQALADLGVSRISINPQTMNDAVLEKIGRKHSTAQTLEAYRLAKAVGFASVNMDLIAGLPGDTPETYADSLRRVIALAPENITVHTLALKKGADLFWNREQLPTGAQVAQMLDDSNALLRAAGYSPYYLYRQKYMSGSFENVGWSKPGTDGLYNIYMMEERHSILALGSGGMNKINLAQNNLERFHNPKYPQEYIERIDDIIEKKEHIFGLLSRL